MTDIERKRAFVAGLSNTESWRKKVKKMPDSQVIAIYLKEQEGKGKPKHHHDKREKPEDEAPF